MTLRNLLLVMAGGAAGSGARWLIALGAERLTGTAQWGTLVVNVLGSALLGALLASGPGIEPRLSAEARLLLGTGVMGGFTTYSTFNGELLRALQDGALARAGLYLAGTVTLCLSGAALGWALAVR